MPSTLRSLRSMTARGRPPTPALGPTGAASLGAVAGFENAIYQWQQGERRLRGAAPERTRTLEHVTAALVAELRRRLGGRFNSQELVDLYETSTAWCLQVAMTAAPEHPWAWEAGTVVDAAFGRYLREASDYAGGRRAGVE
jgi:hypothetical protein